MQIFKLSQNKLTPTKELKIDFERDLQKVTEQNLEMIFGLKFISSEFHLQSFRIDTLAFDEETKSFVIIEFKRDRSSSVVDQGLTYLNSMLNHKGELIVEYNEKGGRSSILKREDINWKSSRVIFIANSFTVYQQNAIGFKDLPIELWEIKKFDNDTVLYNQLQSSDENKVSLSSVYTGEQVEKVSRELQNNTIDDHFKEGWDDIRELFEELRVQILKIDSRMIENPKPQDYIGYNIGNAKVCSLHPYKSKMELELGRVERKDLKDPEGKVKDIPWEERSWPKQSRYVINSEDDIPYAIFLIKQVWDKFFK